VLLPAIAASNPRFFQRLRSHQQEGERLVWDMARAVRRSCMGMKPVLWPPGISLEQTRLSWGLARFDQPAIGMVSEGVTAWAAAPLNSNR